MGTPTNILRVRGGVRERGACLQGPGAQVDHSPARTPGGAGARSCALRTRRALCLACGSALAV